MVVVQERKGAVSQGRPEVANQTSDLPWSFGLSLVQDPAEASVFGDLGRYRAGYPIRKLLKSRVEFQSKNVPQTCSSYVSPHTQQQLLLELGHIHAETVLVKWDPRPEWTAPTVTAPVKCCGVRLETERA